VEPPMNQDASMLPPATVDTSTLAITDLEAPALLQDTATASSSSLALAVGLLNAGSLLVVQIEQVAVGTPSQPSAGLTDSRQGSPRNSAPGHSPSSTTGNWHIVNNTRRNSFQATNTALNPDQLMSTTTQSKPSDGLTERQGRHRDSVPVPSPYSATRNRHTANNTGRINSPATNHLPFPDQPI
jgi:hypothetical protein